MSRLGRELLQRRDSSPAPTCICGECKKCKHREYMREYYRRPGKAAKRSEYKREYYRSNAEVIRERAREYRRRNIEKIRAYDRARGHRVYNPLAEKARVAISHAVADGKLERQPCETCGDKGEAHHDDYSKPFDVRWLCRAHHMELHRKVA